MISWWHSWWKRRVFSANNKSKEHLVLVRKGPGYLAVQNASWTSLSILSKWSVLFIYRIYLYACSVGASLLLCSAEKSMDASLSNLLPPFPFLSRRYKFSCWISFFINIFTKWRTLKIRSIFDESWKRDTSFCYSFALELLDPITTEGTYILRWNRLSKKVWKSISQSIHDIILFIFVSRIIPTRLNRSFVSNLPFFPFCYLLYYIEVNMYIFIFLLSLITSFFNSFFTFLK